MSLMLLGIAFVGGGSEDPRDDLLGARQLDEETLVAAVDTLRALELLYLVKADVEVIALEVVDIELRQLLEYVELGIEGIGRPTLAPTGEISLPATHRSMLAWGLDDGTCPGIPRLLFSLALELAFK